MRQENKLFLSLAGLITGISLRYNNCPPALFVIILLSSFLLLLDNKKVWFFTVFILAGASISHIHSRIPANHIINIVYPSQDSSSHHLLSLSPPGKGEGEGDMLTEAEGRILSAKPDTFSTAYVVRMESVAARSGGRLKTSGKILLKTNSRQYSAFATGTRLTLKNLSLKQIPPPKNPYTFDYRIFMRRRGIYLEGKADELLAHPGSRCALSGLPRKTRSMLAGKIERCFLYFPEEGALLETITLGKEKIPDFLREAGTRSGTYHLLVISGLHIAFILLFLKIIFIPFAGINNSYPKFFPLFSLLFMWFYAGMTGFRTPIVRAVLMLSFFNAGEIVERDIDGINSIMAAAVLMLLLNPYSLFDASFQLSFVATAGIILACRRFNLLNRNFFHGLAFSSLAAQAAVFPLLVYHFGVFYPAGLVNNFLFLPFTGLLLISALVFFLFPFLCIPLQYLLTGFLRGIASAAQAAPFALNFPAPPWFLPAFYGTVFLAFYAPRKKTATLLLAAVAAGSLLFGAAEMRLRKPGTDRLYFLSLSRPSALCVSGNNTSAAFLAGHYKKPDIENAVIPILKKERIKNIDRLFYTVSAYNNIGTLKGLQKAAEIRLFDFLPDGRKFSTDGLEVEALGGEKGMLCYILKNGNTAILFAPHIGEAVSEKIRGRKFAAACIYDIRANAKTRKNLETLDYLYLIVPRNYKKFSNLPSPRIKTFYLNDGALRMDFSPAPFRLSRFYQ